MSSTLIDGKQIAQDIRNELKEEISNLHLKPVLAVVLVGERKDSQTYVRMKMKACKEVGIESQDHIMPADITEEKLLVLVRSLNSNPNVDGILVQLPLPGHINQNTIIETISPQKDVDGLTRHNQGLLADLSTEPEFYPCTPYGCLTLLKRHNVEIKGKKAVVLGRSKIVGLPMALLLLRENATITICHSRTSQNDLIANLKNADIIVSAVGKPQFVKSEWLNSNAVVIDVGINAVDDATRKSGYRLVGDVEKDALEKVKLMTPVPGGVGPMTIATLLQNTVKSHQKRILVLP